MDTMEKLIVELKAPNGLTFSLPTGLFINNEFVESTGGQMASISPITGEEICSVEAASEVDVDTAVELAETAMLDGSEWRRLNGGVRGMLLQKLADLVEQHKLTLATIETWDTGKPYVVALEKDLAAAIAVLCYYSDLADRLYGRLVPITAPKPVFTLKQPIGVCGEILSWSYPLLMAVSKLAPALATGNTIVLKPAEQTPLSVLYFADLVRQAGFPPGVVNIVNGYDDEAGKALASHPDLKKISFTGSAITGGQMIRMADINEDKITVETGSKSPLIVYADADIDQAAKWIYKGILNNQGHLYPLTPRVLVQEPIRDEFLKVFAEYITANSKVGDPFAEGTTHGPQISQEQHDKLLEQIERATEQGAQVLLGGLSAQTGLTNGKGFFIQPTVLSNVNETMDIFRDEILGPVIPVTTFHEDNDMVPLANDAEHNLFAAVFSESTSKGHEIAFQLEVELPFVNSCNLDIQVPPHSGKRSKVGNVLDETGVAPYMKTKGLYINRDEKA